jgi:pimeloyl-ACP methyl ester carboxylesterase
VTDIGLITGTDDVISPPANSVNLAEKIPGAWLVQIKGGGHGLMFQYPDKVVEVLETFLSLS